MASSPPKLLDQARAVLRSKHYALRTEESYIGWIIRYIHFHQKRHPRDLGPADITWRGGFQIVYDTRQHVAGRSGADEGLIVTLA